MTAWLDPSPTLSPRQSLVWCWDRLEDLDSGANPLTSRAYFPFCILPSERPPPHFLNPGRVAAQIPGMFNTKPLGVIFLTRLRPQVLFKATFL